MYSQVRQNVIQRVQTTIDNHTKPNVNRNRSGRPKYKSRYYYKSFTYPQLRNADCTKDDLGRFCVNLPKIGLVPLAYNRSIPQGFKG